VIRGLVARPRVARMPSMGLGHSPRMVPAGSLGRPSR
jgi:hypothetical protein